MSVADQVVCLCCCFFFFKQKTAYEMRISDWSSDVCSSDLAILQRPDRSAGAVEALDHRLRHQQRIFQNGRRDEHLGLLAKMKALRATLAGNIDAEIGRASCRERVCQYG